MRSVQTFGSTQDQRPRISPACLALKGTVARFLSTFLSVTLSTFLSPFAPRPLRRFSARMGTLTPRQVSHPTEVSPLHVTRHSRPFCLQTPHAPPSPLSHATPQLDGFPLTGSRLRHWLAGSPGTSGRIEFVSCGLVSHLRLLSTSPRGDAVTFGFQAGERMPGEDLHLYTCALAGALAQGIALGCGRSRSSMRPEGPRYEGHRKRIFAPIAPRWGS